MLQDGIYIVTKGLKSLSHIHSTFDEHQHFKTAKFDIIIHYYVLSNRARGPSGEIFVLTFKAYGPSFGPYVLNVRTNISRMDRNLG